MRTYPIGHFDLYGGEWFERALADELYFLRRHLASPAASDGRVAASIKAAG